MEQRVTGMMQVFAPVPRSGDGTGDSSQGSFAESVSQYRTEIIDVGGGDSDGQDSREGPLTPGDGTGGTRGGGMDGEPAKKGPRKVSEGGWTMAKKITLARLAEEFRPFKVSGRKSTITDQWNLLVAKIAEQKDGPIGITLAGIPKSRLESHFGLLLKRKRESNHKANVSSGGTSPQLEGQEAELDKIMGNIVDAISSDHNAKKMEAAKRAERNRLGTKEMERGRELCGPSARATPFGEPLRGSRGGGNSRGGGGSRGGGSYHVKQDAGDAWWENAFEIFKRRSIKGLGRALDDCYHEGFDSFDVRQKAIETHEEVEAVLEGGWHGSLVSDVSVFHIMQVILHVACQTYECGKMDTRWDGNDEDWDNTLFRGLRADDGPRGGRFPDVLETLCSHYGADSTNLKNMLKPDEFRLYTEGWEGEEVDTNFLHEIQRHLAIMLLCGPYYVPVTTFRARHDGKENAEDSDSMSGGEEGEGGQPNVKGKQTARTPKTNRKPRTFPNKAKEDGMLTFMQEAAKQNALDQQARWKADRERADQMALDAAKARKLERDEDARIREDMRRAEREEARDRDIAERVREKDRREQDRLDRKAEREEAHALATAARKEARLDEEARRDHELKMITARIELARNTAK